MAHFAKILDTKVVEVIVVSNDDAPDEATGQTFLASLGLVGEWVQTSYNNNPIEGASRGKYAGIGDTWNGTEFVAPKPYPSWTWANNIWNAPTPMPTTGTYRWNEAELAWVAI